MSSLPFGNREGLPLSAVILKPSIAIACERCERIAQLMGYHREDCILAPLVLRCATSRAIFEAPHAAARVRTGER